MQREHSAGYELRVVLLLGLTYGFAYFDRMTMTFLSPFVVKEFSLNNTQVGALGSGLSLTWALGAYFIGRWSDKTGVRKPFLLAATIIFSVCSVLSGLSNGFWMLLVTRVVMGAVEGPFLPIVLAIMTVVSAPQRRGLNTGIVQNAFGSLLGNALAPVVVVWIAVNWGWRTSFYLAGLPGLILFFLVWRFIDEPPRLPAGAASQAEDKGAGILAMLSERNILLCAIISCLMIGSLVLGSIFLPLYLTQIRGYTPTTMANIMAVLGFTPAVGGILVTWISDRIGRRLPMIVFGLLTALCPLAALWFEGSVPMLTTLMFIGWVGIGMYPLFMGVVPAETLNFRNVAAAMGIVVAIGELTGGVCGPILAGWIADNTSLHMPLLIAAAMSIGGGLVSLLIRETNPVILARRTATAG